MGKCEHGLTSRECYVCASPKYGPTGKEHLQVAQQPFPPPEAKTKAEQIAYCAGWWAAMEAKAKEQQAEPVAWRYRTDQTGEKWVVSQLSPQQVQEWNDIVDSVPLYAAPPDHREAKRMLDLYAETNASQAQRVMALSADLDRAHEVMQQALGALLRGRHQIVGVLVQQDQDAAITALRAALGEKE